MASPRRASARQSSSSTTAVNGAVHQLPAKSTGKAAARDSGTAMVPPIPAEAILEDRSSDVEYVGPAASNSTAVAMKVVSANGNAKAIAPKITTTTTAIAATRSSSEELTDLEVLDKALTPASKKTTTRKRKAKDKQLAEAPDSVDGTGTKDEPTDGKVKVKRKRTKKVQGPYLPIVQYPERDLQGK